MTGMDFTPEAHHITGSRSVMCVENVCYDEPQIVPVPEEEEAILTLSNFGLTSAVDLFSLADSTADITTNCVVMYGEGARAANWSELSAFMTASPSEVFRIIENFLMATDGDTALINNDDLPGNRYMVNRVNAETLSLIELNDNTDRKAVCYRP